MGKFLRWFIGLVCLGLILVMAIPAGATSGDRWLAFDRIPGPAQPSLTVLSSSSTAIDLRASLPGSHAAEIKAGGQVFTQLSGDGYGHATVVGWPDVPVLRQDVEIPFGAEVTLELVQADYADYRLVDLGLYPIYPLQPPLVKLQSAEQSAQFQIDRDFYAHGTLYPSSPLALGEVFVVRGHRVQPVEVWPVAYDPSAGTVRLMRSVTFRLRLSGSDMARTMALAQRYASPAYETRLAGEILNHNQGQPPVQFAPDTQVGYLIITADAYYDVMQPFVPFKQSRGFAVTITKQSEIPNGTTTAGIKAYIQNAYDNWAIPPSYVLLVGDTDKMPAWTGQVSTTATDLYYATMDGPSDWHPDIGRGRFPVRTALQASNMVAKYITYGDLTGQEPWLKKVSFPATCDNYYVAEGTHNYVVATYTMPGGWWGNFPEDPWPGGDKLYCVTYNATHQNLVNSFNLGRWAIIYSGHGSYSGWEMSFVPADIQNMTAYGMFPFVASHACLTGDYSQTEVFGETWVLQQNKGALVFWGSTNLTYWGEDDTLERTMFDDLFAAGPHPAVAEMTDTGLDGVESQWPTSARYYREEYNILGDPGVKIFLEPDLPTFTLSVDPSQQEVCSSGSVNSTATVGSVLGYNGTVYLDTQPLPAGITASFDPASAPAPYTSAMTLDVAPGTAPGDYDTVVEATDGNITLNSTVDLRIVPGVPAAPALTSPADGAVDQPFAPTFTWDTVPYAGTYNFQLGTSPLFTAPIFEVSGLTQPTYTATSPLEGGKCFWWRTEGANACGSGAWAAPFHFATAALQLGFFDDMESGAGLWTHQAVQGTDHWVITADESHSPTRSWYVPDDGVITDTRLWNTNAVPVGNASSLTFWHKYQFEGTNYDGSVLEISTDGGQNWIDLGPSITANGYNGTIASGYSNPLAGREGWTGDLLDWTQVTVDLSSFAGSSVNIRWRLGCDSSVSDTGWFIDDVQITSPLPPNPAPTVDSITPNSGSPDQPTPVQIGGSNFVETPSLRLGETWLEDVVQVSPTELTAVVPAGMAPGTYDLVLYNGDCQVATLPNAFTVGTVEHTMHVDVIRMRAALRTVKYVVTGSVRIVESPRVFVPDATVTAQWTLPGGSHLTQQAITNLKGQAKFRVRSAQAGTYELCVVSAVKTGYLYEPGHNRETCHTVVTP